ncbi:flavin reductase family protein [Salipiger mucosus]|uniref:Nitrilotriacetate monooxygenase component B n=1 Tax=Salipiger mucosus DSM 16094 TaxID=1123237 RepID=S9RRP3_9RHOB|nr:flavin reductase family protein [Salipiger mucosus]EPX76604.1 Nitrilotriacetate monooxygenase component B [Salipiger mucosus DSM 16094]
MSDTDTPIDPRELRRACGSFATGVTVITTRTEEGDHGMTANAFMSVSLDPPLLTISLDKGCRMLGLVRRSGRYAVNVLSDHMEDVAMHFAGKPDPKLRTARGSRNGLPVLPDAQAVFLTQVEREIEVGDHVLFIGRVHDFDCKEALAPLLFCGGRFERLTAAAG